MEETDFGYQWNTGHTFCLVQDSNQSSLTLTIQHVSHLATEITQPPICVTVTDLISLFGWVWIIPLLILFDS